MVVLIQYKRRGEMGDGFVLYVQKSRFLEIFGIMNSSDEAGVLFSSLAR
jgi:hypothetical protein